MLTGEPVPVEKKAGDKLIGGTVNQTGSFLMVADKVGADFVTADFRELLRRPEVTAVVVSTDEHLHVDPIMAAITIWSAVHGVASVLQLGFALPRAVEDALVDEVSDRLLAGYGARP